ncbi:quinohemoprotein amine dehydrogenase subunit alpha [Antarctobacter sp.]|uniref:quinohemoprotein amine dehydrogenase subunit alpha n=1 Tax=Antarctobacter sp. TaxID=1872577 RepID=UPI002B27545B|nr:quinohemoprotein amine dehydrogenase subunit alpha [Antarctobacter sp.]
MMNRGGALVLAAICTVAGGFAQAQDGKELLETTCGTCHAMTDAGLTRISGQRKSPEGWLMTIVRMRIYHGLDISVDEQADLVAYLADTQGLAPSETADWRYALEKDPTHVEAIDEPLGTMCARCHTGARVALQRRTAEEWALHMDFHVGQFPTIEYQALGRDREWYKIASEEIVPLLAETYPLETDAWTAWQAADKPDAAGDWVVLTDLPGSGPAYGTLTVAGDAAPYAVTGEMTLADGTTAPVGGQMNLYTGFEWRANLTIGGNAYRQVLAMSEDGSALAGRQFLRDDDSLGGQLTAAKVGSGPALLGVVPEAIAGQDAMVQVVGTGLDDMQIEGSNGLADQVTANAFGATAHLAGESAGFTFSAGDDTAKAALFDTLDRLTVEPGFTIARVGGGSDNGPAPVPARFKAIGWWNGPDGTPDTDDDIRLGAVDAEWSVENHDDIAEAMKDAAFAGQIGADGIFTPAVAGPNPERPFSTNNAGDLKIVAKAAGLTGDAQLIVTVQRFIDPPIR